MHIIKINIQSFSKYGNQVNKEGYDNKHYMCIEYHIFYLLYFDFFIIKIWFPHFDVFFELKIIVFWHQSGEMKWTYLDQSCRYLYEYHIYLLWQFILYDIWLLRHRYQHTRICFIVDVKKSELIFAFINISSYMMSRICICKIYI